MAVRRRSEGGYAMAALLVSVAMVSIFLSIAMPAWRHQAQREKEAELVFRGEQYARAIGLFQRKYAGAFPPNLDVLVEQRFLRRMYKDPMSEDGEFQVLHLTSPQAGAPNAGTRPGPSSPSPPTTVGGRGVGPTAGVVGVTSKSKAESIRVYNGQTRYNEWQFVYTPVTQQPGAPEGSAPQPGAPGGAPQPGRFGRPDRPGSPSDRTPNPGSIQPPPFPPGGPQPRPDTPRIRF